MSDSGDSDDSLYLYDPEVDIERMISLFDQARGQLLGALPPDAPFAPLLRNRKAMERYINMVLCGIIDGEEHKLTIPDNRDVLSEQESRILRDIDSALIFKQRFPWSGSYDVFTTFNTAMSITHSLHCLVGFEQPEDEVDDDDDEDPADRPIEFRDPGKDPNVYWGICGSNGSRHRLYLVLPDAVGYEMDDIHKQIFDANRAAAHQFILDCTTGWSPTYSAEYDRTAHFNESTGRSDSRKSIPSNVGLDFGDFVMDAIRQQPWGLHSYWFLQVRGTKDVTHQNRPLRQRDIRNLLPEVILEDSQTFVDMGVEVHLSREWANFPARSEESHRQLAEIVFGFADNEWDYKDYQVDVWAGVQDVAGYRCNFSRHPRTANQISYLQVYSTDKFQTYLPSSRIKSAMLVGKDVLKMDNADVPPIQLGKVYDAIGDNQRSGTPTVTRIEARVPLEHATTVYSRDLRPEDLAPCLHVVSAKAPWAWRAHRLLAIYLLIRWAAAVKRDSRADIQYLTLVGSAIYLYNALHARPAEMSWDRLLTELLWDSACVDEDDTVYYRSLRTPRNQSEMVPVMVRGAMWFPPIMYPQPGGGDVLRFKFRTQTAPESLISKVFNLPFKTIKQMFLPQHLNNPHASGHLAKRRTKTSDAPVTRAIVLPVGVRDHKYKKERRYYDHAADLPPDAQIGQAPPTEKKRSFSEYFLGLLMQLMQRCGTTKAGQRYSRFEDVDLRRVNLNTFRDTNLSTYFDSYQYMRSPRDWAALKLVLFPGVTDPIPILADPHTQGWKQVPLYLEYLELRSVGGPEFEKLRRFCLTMFDTLKWCPRSSLTRALDNRSKPNWTHMFWAGMQRGVPISLNPAFNDPVTMIPNRPAVLDELPPDEEEVNRRAAREQHELGMTPFARALHGITLDGNSDDEVVPQASGSIPPDVIAYARARGPKVNGRTVIGRFHRALTPIELSSDEE